MNSSVLSLWKGRHSKEEETFKNGILIIKLPTLYIAYSKIMILQLRGYILMNIDLN